MQIVFACCSLPFGKSEMKYEIEAKLHFFSQNIDFDCLLLYKKFSFENFEIGWKNEVLRNCSAHHASQDSLYNSGSDFLFKDFSAIIGFWSFPSWVFDNTFEARLFDPIFIKIRFPCIRPPIVSDHFNSVIFGHTKQLLLSTSAYLQVSYWKMYLKSNIKSYCWLSSRNQISGLNALGVLPRVISLQIHIRVYSSGNNTILICLAMNTIYVFSFEDDAEGDDINKEENELHPIDCDDTE